MLDYMDPILKMYRKFGPENGFMRNAFHPRIGKYIEFLKVENV